MFSFGHNPFAPSYQPYEPYEQVILQQELQRRRQAEEYARRRQLEELNRRRAAQLEYARREAELKRRREAEALHRREIELEARRRKLSEPAHLRGPRIGGPGSRHSMFDGGMQDLFDALYGRPHPRSPSPAATERRPMSSAPRTTRGRSSSVEPKTKVRFAAEDSAVSDTEGPVTDGPASKAAPTVSSTPEDAADVAETQQVDMFSSRKAITDILSKFSSLKSGFTFPTTLDFLPSPEGVSTPTPRLAYTPNNAPLHQYEHLLTGLLTQLDAVESYGDAEVRKTRKDAVKEVEKELEELDGKKVYEWRRQFEPAVSEIMAIEPISDTTPDINTTQDAPSTEEFTLQSQASVDPASVPLPSDEDRELQIDDPEPPATSPKPMALDVPTQPSLPQGDEEHADINSQQPSAHSELTEQVVPPTPSSPSTRNAEPTQATPRVDIPTSEAMVTEHDAAEDDYVSVPSAENVGVAHPVAEGSEEGHIKDDWELNF
ncbi:hypothetical protein FRC10_008378 [Ceratobasidium sp. 414]|nr:hypothetical protein FRC10_008378 [Ceratobasidium sp. 414]